MLQCVAVCSNPRAHTVGGRLDQHDAGGVVGDKDFSKNSASSALPVQNHFRGDFLRMFTLRLGCFEVGGEGVGVVRGSKTLIEPLAGAEVEEGITGPKHLVNETKSRVSVPLVQSLCKSIELETFQNFYHVAQKAPV